MLKHPFYADNDKLNILVITTVHGTPEYRVNCKKFPEGYYVKEKDLVLVDNEWVKKSNQIFDHELQKFVGKSLNLVKGVVGFKEDGSVDIGFFSRNPLKNCTVYTGSTMQQCIDYKLVPLNHYVERLNDGIFLRKSVLTTEQIRSFAKDKTINADYRNANYNIIDDKNKLELVKKIYDSNTISLDKDIKYVSKYISGITFGAELETTKGFLPEYFCMQYGIITCKDGSIRDRNGNYPPEFVFIPLEGAKGLQSLRNGSKEIAKRSEIGIQCSYHLHIGGFKIDRLFVTSLFMLCVKIQKEVFEMFPHYKLDEIKHAQKEKNYCKKLPSLFSYYKEGDFNKYINSSYEDIFMFLTGGKKFDVDFNVKNKANPWGKNKWDILSRYYWVNFVNPLFGKHDTIEFRLHTPTLNSDKIINWLLICNAIIKFAQRNPKRCLTSEKIKFEDVLNYYGDVYKTNYSKQLSKNLVAYWFSRKQQFKQSAKEGDYICEYEFTKDADFKFNTLEIS